MRIFSRRKKLAVTVEERTSNPTFQGSLKGKNFLKLLSCTLALILLVALPTGPAFAVPSFFPSTQAAATTDVRIPPSLVSFERISPDLIPLTTSVSFKWKVRDVPLAYISVYMEDELGRSINGSKATYGAMEGIIEIEVPDYAYGGRIKVRSVFIQSSLNAVDYFRDGGFIKYPSGINDPRPVKINFDGLGFNTEKLGVIKHSRPKLKPQNPYVNSTFSLEPITWSPIPDTLHYQWLRDEQAILGENGQTYKIKPGDIGSVFSLQVTAKKNGYLPATVVAGGIDQIIPAPLSTVVPTITGTKTVGSTLTAHTGLWGPSPVHFAYQWNSEEKPISGANAKVYVLKDSDVGKSFTVSVTGSKESHQTVTKTSVATTKIQLRQFSPKVPTLSGEAKVGSTLTAHPGNWAPAPVRFEYYWSRDGKPIASANGPSYQLTADDLGTRISVLAEGHKSGYDHYPMTSELTDVVAPGSLISSVPKITGIPKVGELLSVNIGKWGPDPVQIGFKWLRNGVAIPNAIGSEYRLTSADAGKIIEVSATGKLWAYNTETKTSAPTVKIDPGILLVTPQTPKVDRLSGNYTIPSVTGVNYLVNEELRSPGTYKSGYSKISITAEAQSGYALSGTVSWSFDLRKKISIATEPKVNYSTRVLSIPSVAGVSYYVDGVHKKPGSHKFSKQIAVTAKASAANYQVAEKSWKYDLRANVTASKPVFNAKKNTVKIPSKTGVTYYVNGTKKKAGTHKYTGTGTVTAKASSGSYKLSGTKSWKFDNRNSVTASKPVFNAKKNTVKIPSKTGVTYYVNGTKKKAGTHKYTGKVTVAAKPSSGGYKLKGIKSWSAKL